jgi:NAD-dependent oxidoreductase involved in siderophore biosynthesis
VEAPEDLGSTFGMVYNSHHFVANFTPKRSRFTFYGLVGSGSPPVRRSKALRHRLDASTTDLFATQRVNQI